MKMGATSRSPQGSDLARGAVRDRGIWLNRICEAADLFYMRKDRRRCFREDPSVCGPKGYAMKVCFSWRFKKFCSS